jgi:hypothetical protein
MVSLGKIAQENTGWSKEIDLNSRQKTGLGAMLTGLGGLGMALGPSLGVTELTRPWGFLAGFFTGVICGVGVALAVAGLLAQRQGK